KEQHQQPIRDGLQRAVDAGHHAPHCTTVVADRADRQHPPDFIELVVPGVEGIGQVVDDPVIVRTASPPSLPWHGHGPTIRSRISFANVIIMPPASVRKPWLRWLGSWLCSDRPIWTMPQPSRIRPTARMTLKIKVFRLPMTASGSVVAASAGMARQQAATTAAYRAKPRRRRRVMGLLFSRFLVFRFMGFIGRPPCGSMWNGAEGRLRRLGLGQKIIHVQQFP